MITVLVINQDLYNRVVDGYIMAIKTFIDRYVVNIVLGDISEYFDTAFIADIVKTVSSIPEPTPEDVFRIATDKILTHSKEAYAKYMAGFDCNWVHEVSEQEFIDGLGHALITNLRRTHQDLSTMVLTLLSEYRRRTSNNREIDYVAYDWLNKTLVCEDQA